MYHSNFSILRIQVKLNGIDIIIRFFRSHTRKKGRKKRGRRNQPIIHRVKKTEEWFVGQKESHGTYQHVINREKRLRSSL
jgi:hypothetical protein